MAAITTGLIIASIVGAALAATASAASTAVNYKSIQDTNATNKQNVEASNYANLQIARENNAMQMDLAKNGISYKMQDLDNAGLNPVLAAGGMSSPSATLSTPHLQAAQAQAPLVDFNGVSSAVNALNNTLLTQYIMEGKKDIAEGRNNVLGELYQRKGAYIRGASGSSAYINSATPINRVMSGKNGDISEKEIKDIIKAISKKPHNAYY